MARWVLCFALIAPAAFAEGTALNRFLNAAQRLYENLEYERALEQVQNARREAATPDEQALVNLYEGMVLFDIGRTEDARGAFRAGLLLSPDAQLPIKVSPKVRSEFEQIRDSVKRELAPLLARQEEERRRKADKDRLTAELRDARDAAAKDLAAKEAAAKETAAREATAKEAAAKEAAAKELAAKEAAAARAGAPVVAQLTPAPTPAAPELVEPAPLPRSRGFPVLATVLLGAGAVSGGLGGYFGSQSQGAVDAAKSEMYQQPAAAHLARAQPNATAANVLFASAGALAVSALIAGIVWYVSPP